MDWDELEEGLNAFPITTAGLNHGEENPMPRELTDHKQNNANEQITIQVMDEPGHGGANHEYDVIFPKGGGFTLSFQNGPIKEAGVNGVTHEVMLAVLIDRMKGFQAGDYACHENQKALNCMEEALGYLQSRTNDRVERGVEGTHKQ